MTTTTIQISKSTKQMLEAVKKKEQVSSYDLVIKSLLEKEKNVSSSLFGKFPHLKWTKKDRGEFREL